MIKKSKTAILIFAHSAEYEAKIKPFQYAEEVFESLNQHTLQLVKRTKLPYYVVTEKEQIGDSFGERFTNAIQSIYYLGYESIITIGNDTPHLTTAKLLKASQELIKKDIVLGSSTDGGFYLLGLHKKHFDPNLFLKLPWQKPTLSIALISMFLDYSTPVVRLPILVDIDEIGDIKSILNGSYVTYNELFQIFLLIFSEREKIKSFRFNEFSFSYSSRLYNKGSPYYI